MDRELTDHQAARAAFNLAAEQAGVLEYADPQIKWEMRLYARGDRQIPVQVARPRERRPRRVSRTVARTVGSRGDPDPEPEPPLSADRLRHAALLLRLVRLPGGVVAERDFQSAVVPCARLFGWRVAHFRAAQTKHGWRTPVEADGKGFPDLLLLHPCHGLSCAS
jgi:hypothetical protein